MGPAAIQAGVQSPLSPAPGPGQSAGSSPGSPRSLLGHPGASQRGSRCAADGGIASGRTRFGPGTQAPLDPRTRHRPPGHRRSVLGGRLTEGEASRPGSPIPGTGRPASCRPVGRLRSPQTPGGPPPTSEEEEGGIALRADAPHRPLNPLPGDFSPPPPPQGERRVGLEKSSTQPLSQQVSGKIDEVHRRPSRRIAALGWRGRRPGESSGPGRHDENAAMSRSITASLPRAGRTAWCGGSSASEGIEVVRLRVRGVDRAASPRRRPDDQSARQSPHGLLPVGRDHDDLRADFRSISWAR